MFIRAIIVDLGGVLLEVVDIKKGGRLGLGKGEHVRIANISRLR